MIETYRVIGKIVKERERFAKKSPAEQKRFMLLQYCSDLEDYTKQDKHGNISIGRLLVLNLNTHTKQCSFNLGEQLNCNEYAKLMLFYRKAPNDPNIYAVTNSIYSILRFELWKFLGEQFKHVNWSNKQLALEFKDFLEDIKNTFFVDTDYGFILDKSTITSSQQDGFPHPNADQAFQGAEKKSSYSKLLSAQIDFYTKKTLQGLYDSNQGYAIKVDGDFLHEGRFASAYLEYMHYYLLEQNYTQSNQDGICHVCHEKKALGRKVSLKQKFYGSKNPLFFDSLKNNRTCTSFGMCSVCDEDITIGTNELINTMGFNLLNISSFVLPSVSLLNVHDAEIIDRDNLSAIEKTLSPKGRVDHNIDAQISALRRMADKTGAFNILFYDKDPVKQDFKIISYIRDASFTDLIEKSSDLENLTDEWSLYSIGNGIDLSLKGLRMLIIPSKRSHKIKTDGEFDVVGRQIVSLAETYLNNRQLDYSSTIRSFIDIWSRIESDNQTKYLDHDIAAFILQLYLAHLHKFNQIKGVRTMDNNEMTTDLSEDKHGKYLEYFKINDYVYGKNKFYRGLFLLGTLVSDIESAEYRKTKKKTFSNRLNYRGISPRKVQGLYDVVEEYCKIRDVYDDPQLRAYCLEALTGIDQSNLLPDEVIFYILAGKAYCTYQSILHSKNNQPNLEETNDQQ